MRLVIDIPENYYNVIKSIPDRQCNADMLIIKYGTPLPKGHGRIIDESKITACEWDGQQMTTNAPTIIAADTEDDK